MSGNNEFKYLVVVGLGFVLAGSVAVGVVSEKPLLEAAESVQRGEVFSPEYLAARKSLSMVSRQAWRIHPWIGSGLGSFAENLRFSVTNEDWRSIPPDQACAVNGYWQFLVERGIAGAFFVFCPLVLMLVTYFHRLVSGVRRHLPAPTAWSGLFALFAVLILAAVDCSVFYPGIVVLTAAMLSISANSFPKEKLNG